MPSYQLDPERAAPARLGRYELIGHLATGGMAEIHLARLSGEAGFEKVVVVKRLLPELVASPAFVAMFLDEGKLVARLDHPNVCEVFELGREGAEYFLAMPFLDGVPIADLIARPRDPDRAAELRIAAAVIVQACAGLHHAHELSDADGAPAGLVHRDVSPSNLFVTASGVVKVLDFGVAKVRGAAETEAGTIKGKTQYMAPEQLLGEPLDRRCDVFALGIVLYELATHQRLFKRTSDYLAARAILEDPIPRADEADPAVPGQLADVIAKALARDRSARYATAAELGAAIETAAVTAMAGGLASTAAIAAAVTATDELSAQRTRQARVLGEAKSRGGSLPATRMFHGEPTVVEPRRANPRPIALALGALVVVGAITIALAVRWSSRRDTGTDDRASPAGHETHGDRADASGGRTTEHQGSATDTVGADHAVPDRRSTVATAADHDDPASPDRQRVDASTIGTGADHRGTGSADLPPTTSGTAGDDPSPADHGAPAPGHGAVPSRAPGKISIGSTPFATIFVDGTRLDVTPILGHTLPAGRHRVRAVLGDGRSKELVVDVPPGRAAKPIVLTW